MTLTFSKTIDGKMLVQIDKNQEVFPFTRDQAVALLLYLTQSCFEVEDGMTVKFELPDQRPNPGLHCGSAFPTKGTSFSV